MDRMLKEHPPKNDAKEKKADNHSFLAILFSVFVALILWFYVQDAETPDYKKTFSSIPVQMQSLASSFSVIEGGESFVDITLVGKRSDLNKIKANDLEAYIDLSSILQSGTYDPAINVLLPEGTELYDCFPSKAAIFVDQTISVPLPVVVEMGSYEASDNIGIEARPAVEEITVKGPESVLGQVHHVGVFAGDLGQIGGSFERNLEYHLYDENGRIIENRHIVLPERNLKVQFTVYKTKAVPLTVKSLHGWWKEENMKYTVSPETVLIKGEPSLVDGVSSIPAVVVDETKLDSTRYTETLTPGQIVLPEGVELGETLGDVKVNLTLTDNGSKTIKMNLSSNHVAVTPPSGEKTFSFEASSFSFKVRGSFDALQEASEGDFYLNIDLSEVTASGEVPVQIVQTSASEGKYYPVGTYTISVIIN